MESLTGIEARRIYIDNAVLAAAGCNIGLFLRWVAALLRVLLRAFVRIHSAGQTA